MLMGRDNYNKDEEEEEEEYISSYLYTPDALIDCIVNVNRAHMVTTQPESGTADTVTPDDTGTTFSKLRQLMTVTGNAIRRRCFLVGICSQERHRFRLEPDRFPNLDFYLLAEAVLLPVE
ncbi:hypothetical protein PV325_003903 [Microctonus aethiopoides]|nr:hypothetical protein PV325_003903 [Microctonus aethiopoides]